MRQLLRDFVQAVVFVAILFVVYAVVEDDRGGGISRAQYAQWIDDSCLPRRQDERAIAVLDEGKLRCTIIGNSGYGKAPRIVSAAVMERP